MDMGDFNEIKPIKSELSIQGLTEEGLKNVKANHQRSEEWFRARSGNFTGSKISDLMSCGRSSAKMGWGDINKICDFGKGAESIVFQVGQERLTGFRSMQVSTREMNHGIIHEPLLIEKLLDDEVIEHFEECEYVPHPEVKHLGASPDGVFTYLNEDVAGECKCVTSWSGFQKRMYKPVDEKHCDWWQFQTEMMVLGVDKLLYVVSYPMTIDKYKLVLVKASKTHQEAIIKRVQIANLAISKWSDDYGYESALYEAISEFKVSGEFQ